MLHTEEAFQLHVWALGHSSLTSLAHLTTNQHAPRMGNSSCWKQWFEITMVQVPVYIPFSMAPREFCTMQIPCTNISWLLPLQSSMLHWFGVHFWTFTSHLLLVPTATPGTSISRSQSGRKQHLCVSGLYSRDIKVVDGVTQHWIDSGNAWKVHRNTLKTLEDSFLLGGMCWPCEGLSVSVWFKACRTQNPAEAKFAVQKQQLPSNVDTVWWIILLLRLHLHYTSRAGILLRCATMHHMAPCSWHPECFVWNWKSTEKTHKTGQTSRNCATRKKGCEKSLFWAQFRDFWHAFAVFIAISRNYCASQHTKLCLNIPCWHHWSRSAFPF